MRRRHPSLKTLNVLLEVQPFPGLEPESKFLNICIFMGSIKSDNLPILAFYSFSKRAKSKFEDMR